MPPRLQRSELSRMWLIKWRAGPANQPQYEGLWKAGAVDWPQGAATSIYVPDPDQYGQFDVAGKIIGERGSPSLPITARYLPDVRSVLLQLTRAGCDHDLQVHMGECQDPQDFNHGWEKILVLEAARITDYKTTALGAMMPSERAVVDEEVPFTGEELYEILRIIFGEQAAAEVVQEVIDIEICDRITCGACGLPSDGCSVVFALTLSVGGSPGLPAEILFTQDGGDTWADTLVSTLAANEDPNALACVGIYLVVISEDSESLHYAPLADVLTGTETWTEVATGFVATDGPLSIWSADPRHTWIVGENGYIYFTGDPTTGVEVQDAGVATTQNLQAVHGVDGLHLVAVGTNNAVVVSDNGGVTWSPVTGPQAGASLTTVWMLDEDTWIVGTGDGRLWYTNDGGTTWTEKAFPNSGTGSVNEVKFATPTVGEMAYTTAGGVGRILRTIDGGYSWYIAPEGNTSLPDNDGINVIAVCEDDVNIVFGGGLGANGIDGIIVKGAAA